MRPSNLKTNGNKLPRPRRHKRQSFPSQPRRFVNERQAFNQRYGEKANQAYRAAHEFAVQRGLKPDTVGVFQILRRRAGDVRQGLRHEI